MIKKKDESKEEEFDEYDDFSKCKSAIMSENSSGQYRIPDGIKIK